MDQSERVGAILEGECQKRKISREEQRMGSRRGGIPQVRHEVADRLIKELSMLLAEVARLLGACTSAIRRQ